jgi:hypothetical protein
MNSLEASGKGVVVRVIVGHPAPAGLRLDGDPVALVFVGEGLKAGDVAAEGEAAIADGERRVGIEGADDGVVPRDERVAVDFLGGSGKGRSANGDEQDREGEGNRMIGQ